MSGKEKGLKTNKGRRIRFRDHEAGISPPWPDMHSRQRAMGAGMSLSRKKAFTVLLDDPLLGSFVSF